MKAIISAIIVICGFAALATPPVLSNVRASQRTGTKLVDIYYDAEDADGDLLKVRIEVSDNDGAKYSIPARTFTGDIGEGVTPGINKHIVWDAGTDWDGEYSDQMRVKVFAIDAQGFPGMEWSNEVPPGGFLLGQDGGAEGSGESQHVNIPWSYWVAKYEVTNEQYCDFLNAAYVSGYIGLNGSTNVYATSTMPVSYACPIDSVLCNIGDDWGVRWNVNNFEVVGDRASLPAITTWYGAMAFCRFYGYDLPTEAEWEKAARGPDNDDQDEHLVYPWGNSSPTEVQANLDKTNSYRYGLYKDHWSTDCYLKDVHIFTELGGYGLSGMVGNAAEWTRSRAGYTVIEHESEESLKNNRQMVFCDEERVVKGRGCDGLYVRTAVDSAQWYVLDAERYYYYFVGFRPVRRQSNVEDATLVREAYEDFEWMPSSGFYPVSYESYNSNNGVLVSRNNRSWVYRFRDYSYSYSSFSSTSLVSPIGIGFSQSKGVYNISSVTLPDLTGRLAFIRCKVKSVDKYQGSIYIASNKGDGSNIFFPAYMTEFKVVDVQAVIGASQYKLNINSEAYIDEIELWTISE